MLADKNLYICPISTLQSLCVKTHFNIAKVQLTRGNFREGSASLQDLCVKNHFYIDSHQ